jgi:hypothetical protein
VKLIRTGEEVTVWKYLEVVAICRALRWIWQNTEAALIQLAALHLITSSGLVPAAAADSLTALLSPAQLMMILSFIHDRLVQLAEKLYLFVLLTTTSIDNRFSRKGRHRISYPLLFILAYIKPIIEYLRQHVMPLFTKLFSFSIRRKNAMFLFHLNILLFPVVFVFLVVASAASAPVLALFSLPIFLLTFPRPSRFWPNFSGNQASCLQSTELTYVEYRAVSGVFQNIDLPPPFHPTSVSSPRTKGGGCTLARR